MSDSILIQERPRIICPDYYYENPFDTEYLRNPLTQAEWSTNIDDSLLEIAGLSFYSLAWASKYILNTELAPYQAAWLYMLWTKKYPLLLASRGASKTFTLGVYSILRALYDQGSKVVIVSSTFRQAKHIFEEIISIYKRAPLLRQCTKDKPRKSIDHCIFKVGNSTIKALPMGNGEGIRGERASHVVIDEVDSVDPEVMHVVVRGFAATQLDPMNKIKEAAKRKRDGEERIRKPGEGNQIVIAGTAGFTNGNFHKLYTQYKKIIDSKVCGLGYDVAEELGEDFGDMWIDYRDYGSVELPWRFVPEGMLDRDMIANAKMTMSTTLFDMEYNCVFADTSRGFFKHSDLENATGKGKEAFMVKTNGSTHREYVMGVDPARTSDAFAIAILEMCKGHRRLVYCTTMIDSPFTDSSRKILYLANKFNVVAIGIDMGGGGYPVMDFLQDPATLQGELPIYPHDDENKSRQGRYILHPIHFEPKWIEEANFLLQGNIERKEVMFPTKVLGGKGYKGENIEEMEKILQEIENCKKEMMQISVTQTVTGKRHFDIQPSIEDKKRKIKPRKDRYSSLLIANAIAADLADYRNPLKHAVSNWNEPGNFGGWLEDFESY
jgi:hypothetical protein